MKYFALWTDAGRAARALATATNKPLNIEYMAVGDCNSHNGSDPPAPHTRMTELINERHRQQINEKSVSPVNPDAHIYSIVITEEIGGFWMKEVGLFSDAGVLLAVGIMPPSYKPPIGDGAASQYIAQLQLIESPADVINVVIDPSTVLATKSYVSEQIAGVLDKVYPKSEADKRFIKNIDRVGSMVFSFGMTPPAGSLVCNGGEISRTTYADLFSTIGTKYGVGDGSTTFNLPNIPEGMAILSAGNVVNNIGQIVVGSNIRHTHGAVVHEAGLHTHDLLGTNYTGVTNGKSDVAPHYRDARYSGAIVAAGNHIHGVTIHNEGSDNNMAAGMKLLICIAY